MENLKVGDMATLENGKEYICFGTREENGKDYVFLMSNFKPLEIRFATQSKVGNELQITIVKDKETKNHLFETFKDSMA